MYSARQVFGDRILQKRYRLIYADPPWAFETFSENGHGRSAEAHYDCMDEDKIRKLPVSEIADKDCVLLMWARDPMLPMALTVIKEWGFEFKTVGFYWAKLNRGAPEIYFSSRDFFTGLGYWTRGNVEQCLLATRGKPSRKSKGVRKLVITPRREHSRKPDQIYEYIEELVDGPYLELFSRSTRPGWECWGAEVGLFNQRAVETRRRSCYSKPRSGEDANRKKQTETSCRTLDDIWSAGE